MTNMGTRVGMITVQVVTIHPAVMIIIILETMVSVAGIVVTMIMVETIEGVLVHLAMVELNVTGIEEEARVPKADNGTNLSSNFPDVMVPTCQMCR